MKLLLQNFNACDHSPPTLQTDGRTDRQTDRQLIMAIPRYATLRAVTTDVDKLERVQKRGTKLIPGLSKNHTVIG